MAATAVLQSDRSEQSEVSVEVNGRYCCTEYLILVQVPQNP